MRKTKRIIVFPHLFAVVLALSSSLCGHIVSAQDPKLERKPAIGLLGGSDEGISAIKNAPFSGEMVCENVQTLADGNRIVQRTTTMIYRDGAGRIRRESSGKIRSAEGSDAREYKTITILDNAGQTIMLDPQNRTARKVFSAKQPLMERVITARSSNSDPAANKAAIAMGNTCGPGFIKPVLGFIANSEIKDESLGTQTIEGVAAEGTRITHTIQAGSIDNERSIEIVFERWYSQELQLFVLTKTSDPRSGESTGRMTNINLGEPDATLFEIPADYKVTELKPVISDNSANTGAAVFDSPATSQPNQATNGVQPVSDELKPTILYQEKPKYTEEARNNKVEGTVVLSLMFMANGRISGIRVLRGLPDGLTEKAIEAAQKTRFNPAVKDGTPVSVRGTLEFNFSLDK